MSKSEVGVRYIGTWISDSYIQRKIRNFQLIDEYFQTPFKTILDIGCGKAYESREFYKKYGSELWLIEGDANKNNQKSSVARSGKYQDSVNDFLYYFPLEEVKEGLDQSGLGNYKLLDCNNIIIPEDVKFDLITSYLSCGYHYSLDNYKDLILKHSHKDTKLVFDIRNRKGSLVVPDGVEIVKEFYRHGNKYAMCQIRFKKEIA